MQSHAVVFTAPNVVEWKEIVSPDPEPNDVVLELHYSWVSNGTEGSFLRGERLSGDEAWREGDPMPFPMVAGYQKIGRVLSVGSAVTDYKTGDLVFASMSKVTGMFDNRFAGHVSPSVCDQSALMHLPDHPDPLAYSGLVLTQVGYNCGSRSTVEPGQTAVVVGDGLVGNWAAQTLKARGANVFMVGRHPDRLAKAVPYATILHEDGNFGYHQFVREHNTKVQILVETVGKVDGMSTWLPSMNRNGHMVIAGFYNPSGLVDIQTSMQNFRNHELSFDLVSGATKERLEATMEWIRDGKINTIDLVTHRFPVEEAAEAWQLIESKSEPVLGVIFEWPASRPK